MTTYIDGIVNKCKSNIDELHKLCMTLTYKNDENESKLHMLETKTKECDQQAIYISDLEKTVDAHNNTVYALTEKLKTTEKEFNNLKAQYDHELLLKTQYQQQNQNLITAQYKEI